MIFLAEPYPAKKKIILRNSRPTEHIRVRSSEEDTDDIDIVEVCQHGWREKKVNEGENGPNTLLISVMTIKG